MRGLIRQWQAWREARQLRRHAIPDEVWRLVLWHYPFIGGRSTADLTELRRLCSLFLARKEFSGAQGLVVTDLMAVTIAAQACLPVLALGLEAYDSFVGIVVHPDEVLAPRQHLDDDGVMHDWDEVLAGEAMIGGPVMLSWPDVAFETGTGIDAMPYNVVIHEFAHVLDMGDGLADGVPPLPDAGARERWLAILEGEFERFCKAVDLGQEGLLDPYGAEAPEEFFAVASEAFFVAAPAFRVEHPVLYDLLRGYYRQDPANALDRA